MRSPLRIAAALLLAYPTLMLVGKAVFIFHNGWSVYYLHGLPLVLFVAAVGVSLWRGRRWAYSTALFCTAGLALLLVLYKVAMAFVWGSQASEGMTIFLWVLAFLPEASAAIAFALLVRDGTFAWDRSRALTLMAAALAAEAALMGLIAWLGVGGMGGPHSWYQLALGLSQAPGEVLLTQMGMCCGYENETIISDVIDPHWGGITRNGIPVLVVANALGLAAVFAAARALLLRVRQHRRPSRDTAASAVSG